MQIYKTKAAVLSGTNYAEIKRKAWGQYMELKKKTKRKAYIRSAYFGKQKIFFDLFWEHLFKKIFGIR